MTLGSSKVTTTKLDAGWVATETLLPPPDIPVLGCWMTSNGDMDVCVRKSDSAWYTTMGDLTDPPTHWVRLPMLPGEVLTLYTMERARQLRSRRTDG